MPTSVRLLVSRLRSSVRRWATVACCVSVAAPAVADSSLPTVASINLCADQHVLALADPGQIRSVSWLAADPEESSFAATAAKFTLNYGTAEELLAFNPDVVIAGSYTSPFTRALLQRLGYRVVELAPEDSVADIERNVRLVAAALGQIERGERAVATLEEQSRAIVAQQPVHRVAAVVVRPGGFTVGADSLANELMMLAGVRNVAAEQGLDRWGSLSMEALLRSAPDLIVLTGYRNAEPSLANAVLQHPALQRLAATHHTTTVPAALWACGSLRSLESAELLQRAASR
jgi:iron complex transport system substrate-binding protein